MKQLVMFVFCGSLSILCFSQVANKPSDLIVCNIGVYPIVVDLTVKNSEILGSQDPDRFFVGYHEILPTVEDYQEIYPFIDAYFGSLPKTFYASVRDSNTGIFDVTSFVVKFNPSINLRDTEAIVCDDETPDGISTFNKNNLIYSGPDIFYRTLADAQANINRLPYNFTNINPYHDIVYGAKEDSYGCYDIAIIYLYVNPRPVVVTPTDLEVCDDNLDGFATFDLSNKDDEITNDNGSSSILLIIS